MDSSSFSVQHNTTFYHWSLKSPCFCRKSFNVYSIQSQSYTSPCQCLLASVTSIFQSLSSMSPCAGLARWTGCASVLWPRSRWQCGKWRPVESSAVLFIACKYIYQQFAKCRNNPLSGPCSLWSRQDSKPVLNGDPGTNIATSRPTPGWRK